jgi:hypothetical protein
MKKFLIDNIKGRLIAHYRKITNISPENSIIELSNGKFALEVNVDENIKLPLSIELFDKLPE